MSDVYYIVVTVIFGVFVLVMAVWIYKYMRASNPLEMTHEELSDDQKAMIYKFCGEMRRSREAKEFKETKAKEAEKTKTSQPATETRSTRNTRRPRS